jgi:hypothetical protein
MRTDRQTDRQTDMAKLIVAFRNFLKTPAKVKCARARARARHKSIREARKYTFALFLNLCKRWKSASGIRERCSASDGTERLRDRNYSKPYYFLHRLERKRLGGQMWQAS